MGLSANKDNKAQQVECLEYGPERAASGKINNKGNNPLSGLSATELRDQANSFCETYGFQDKVNTFHKAALVAQRPDAFDSIEDLTEDDKHWLRREITSKAFNTSLERLAAVEILTYFKIDGTCHGLCICVSFSSQLVPQSSTFS